MFEGKTPNSEKSLTVSNRERQNSDHDNPEHKKRHQDDDDDDDDTQQLLHHSFHPFAVCFFNITDYSVSNGSVTVYSDM